ncbi:phosphatidylinositol phosphatase PTPRQ-like, partial [Ruditapes philippinarum]|uniref:phosphatidylinositol phosphatase PTPRQ-like n=1 Tax=Ruditapes philippinarum TaxID=129788 RepID=UPI00295AA4B9
MTTPETTNNTITLQWSITPDKFGEVDNFYFVIIEVFQTDANLIKRYTQERNNSLNNTIAVKNLTAGTNYTFRYFLESKIGVPSMKTAIKSSFTRPSPPSSITIPKELVFEKNFTVTYKVFDDLYDFFRLIICNVTCKNYTQQKNTMNMTIGKLKSATYYNVMLYTVKNTSKHELLSEFPVKGNSYSAPNKPIAVLSQTNFTMVTIDLSENNKSLFDSYEITYKNDNVGKEEPITRNRTDLKAVIPNLTPGTSYEFKVYTVLTGIKSENFTTIKTFTRPENVQNVCVAGATTTSIRIKWEKPAKGDADSYEVNFTCKSPNENRNIEPYSFNKTNLESTVTGIDPGSHCNVCITTHIGSQIGCPLYIELNETSKETAPNNPVISYLKPGKRSLNISWNKPTKPNGFVRKYQLLVVDKTLDCLKANHTYCLSSICVDDEDEYQEVSLGDLKKCNGAQYNMKVVPNLPRADVVEQLHPYRQYNVTVRAYTKCWGSFTWLNNETESDVPSAAPTINTLIPTEVGFNISMVPPDEDDRNGVITNYTIRYTWINNTCWDSHDDKNTTWANETEGSMTQFVVQNLLPYRNYSFSIAANTEKGVGNYSFREESQTDIAKPHPPRNPKAKNISSTSIGITWTRPDLFTGPTRYFVIPVDVKNNNKKLNCCEVTGFEANTCTLKGLDEYWTYSITVTAQTDRGNTSSVKFNVSTSENIPSAAPTIKTLIPTEVGFNISMVPPGEEDRNGVITNYTIRYTWINNTCWDSLDGEIVEETIYTNGRSEYEVSIPGVVRNLTIITTSSNASLTWVTPCETNGIITMYSINTTNIDKNTTWANETEGSMTQFVVQNLLPYRNYSFSIAANTEKGVGNYSFREESQTDIAKPHPPRNPKAKNISSTSIGITWTRPDLFTGPTRYFVIPVDVKNNNKKLNCCEVTGFEANTCTLKSLDEYWTYSITVTAQTDRGNTSSVKFNVSTSEN